MHSPSTTQATHSRANAPALRWKRRFGAAPSTERRRWNPYSAPGTAPNEPSTPRCGTFSAPAKQGATRASELPIVPRLGDHPARRQRSGRRQDHAPCGPRYGADHVGYVKRSEDLKGDLGVPFGPLPEGLVGSGEVLAFWPENNPRNPVKSVPEEGVEACVWRCESTAKRSGSWRRRLRVAPKRQRLDSVRAGDGKPLRRHPGRHTSEAVGHRQ